MTTEREISIDLVPLSELQEKNRPGNPKDHDVGAILESVRRLGFVDPVIVNDSDGLLLAGHGRVQALVMMREAGEEAPAGVRDSEVSGDWLVPVLSGVSLEDADATRYVLAANQTVIAGGWLDDDLHDALVALRDDDDGLYGSGFSLDDMDELGALVDPAEVQETPEDVDHTPPVPEQATAKLGDVWRLGAHVLACGDSLEGAMLEAALEELQEDGEALRVDSVITDPPYAIYGSASGITSSIADDRMVVPFFRSALLHFEASVKVFGQVYVCCDWRSWPAWWEAARSTHLEAKNVLVWDKGASGMGSNWANSYELVGFFTLMPVQKTMSSGTPSGQRVVLRSNVLRHQRPRGDEREHNAAKPVDLLRELVTAGTDPGARILDPFVGSGSTLIACELEDRRCVAIDQDPKWVDVTIARWERLTGRTAERVIEGEG